MSTDKSCIFSRKKTACSLKKCSWCLPIDKATTFFRIAIYTHTHNHMSIFSGLHDGMRSSMQQKNIQKTDENIHRKNVWNACGFVCEIHFFFIWNSWKGVLQSIVRWNGLSNFISIHRIKRKILKFIYKQSNRLLSQVNPAFENQFPSLTLSVKYIFLFVLFNVFVSDEIYIEYVQLVLCRLPCDNDIVMRTRFLT